MKRTAALTGQNFAIYAHLRAGKSVTQLEAYHMFGCTRVSERISEIESYLGWERGGNPKTQPILHERIKVGDKHVMRYSLPQEKLKPVQTTINFNNETASGYAINPWNIYRPRG